MISIKNQVPSIYYDASRDFQILGHLYEVVLNYVKTNADMLYQLPNGIETDTRATELLAMTLGFKLKRNYDKAQLAALVSIFPQLLKVKGTVKAIELAGNALVKASGVPGVFAVDTTELKNHVLTIKIPIELSDITLFIDLLPYILPFGIRVSIIRNTIIPLEATTPIGSTAVMRIAYPGDTEYKEFKPHPLGLAKIEALETKTAEGETTVDYVVDYSKFNPQSSLIDASSKAIPGSFGTSPIIAFKVNPNENTQATNINVEDEEDNI